MGTVKAPNGSIVAAADGVQNRGNVQAKAK